MLDFGWHLSAFSYHVLPHNRSGLAEEENLDSIFFFLCTLEILQKNENCVFSFLERLDTPV